MKPADIIKIANKAYPDDMVQQYFDDPNGQHGDTLAKFIASELKETACEEKGERRMLAEAARVMRTAANELERMARAFEARIAMDADVEPGKCADLDK